jgi:hypothetical protein
MGRRCSRGRLGEEVRAGEVDVHDGGLPQLRLLARGRLAVFPARRGGGAPSFLFSSSARRGKGEEKTPTGLVAWRLVFDLSLAFEARRHARRCKNPGLPSV